MLDDEFGGKDLRTVEDRTTGGIPTPLVPVDRYRGQLRSGIDGAGLARQPVGDAA